MKQPMRVLFVDDEKKVLDGLRRLLRGCRKTWDMHYVCGGQEAIDAMAEQPFDVVVSDMRMPNIDGAKLLSTVQRDYPSTVRIVLSGQSELERVMRAVGPAHQFLSKPCDAKLLVDTINRAVALHDQLAEDNLKSLIASVGALPSLPEVYAELHKEVQSEDASVDRVADLISRDLSMTTKVLQLVNSSFFGIPQRITEPGHAVSLLGLDRIRPLVLMAGVFSQFEESAFSAQVFTELSDHSLAVATTARRIAAMEATCDQDIEDAFLAGMLHDLGMLILMTRMPDRYSELVQQAREQGVFLWEVEQEQLHSDHAVLGAYLLSLWGLPDPVVEAVAWHHNPCESRDEVFTPLTAVHAANALLPASSPLNPPDLIPEIDGSYLERLSLARRVPEWQYLASQCATEELAT